MLTDEEITEVVDWQMSKRGSEFGPMVYRQLYSLHELPRGNDFDNPSGDAARWPEPFDDWDLDDPLNWDD